MTRIFTIAQTVWLEMLRRKEFYVLLVLLGILVMSLLSLDVFGLGGVVAYIKDIGLLLIWALSWILAVNLSCRQLPREESQGTIFPLLAKPLSRSELLVGKWMGAWFAVIFAVVCFYILLAAIILLQGGGFPPVVLGQALTLHLMALAVVTALGIALSTRLNHDAAATLTYVLSGSFFLILPRIPSVAMSLDDWRTDVLLVFYYSLPHLELFDIRRRLIHNWEPLSYGTWVEVMFYGLLFTAVFLVAAWLAYRNKRFVRGNIL